MSRVERIRNYLVRHQIPQSRLARALGVSTASLNAILSGKVRLTAEMYLAICDILGVSVTKFEP